MSAGTQTGIGRAPLTLAGSGLSGRIAQLGVWTGQAALPFLLVTYLGIQSGGYDIIVRSEIGIAAWWLVLVGAVIGVLPLSRLQAPQMTLLALLVALGAWTGLATIWSDSAERTVAELGRVATLTGIFALIASVQDRSGLRRVLAGTAAGIVVIGGVALLSRLQPTIFTELEAPELLVGTEARLHFPLDYWNGLAALLGIGIPLLLALVTSARKLIWRIAATTAIPLLALTAFLTLSRGGALAGAVGVAVLAALHPRRLDLIPPGILAAVGSAILIGAANQREALTDGSTSALGLSQGDEMLAMVIVVSIGTAMLAAAAEIARYHDIALVPAIPPGYRRPLLVLAGVVGVAVAIWGAGQASDRWQEFKDPEPVSGGPERFQSASGSGRYQFWETAVDAARSEPLLGIGPGTYEYYWAREGSLAVFSRDAHSLYLEMLAELGIVGLFLIVGLVAGGFAFAARGIRQLSEARQIGIAGALGGAAAFAFAAAIDWAWELTVLPVIFLMLAAAAAWRPDAGSDSEPPVAPRFRTLLAGLAGLALIAIAIPLGSASAVEESKQLFDQNQLGGALERANSAESIQPYAGVPELQRALVLEAGGNLPAALSAARAATEAEPANWRTWLVRSRLETRAGNPAEALRSYRLARSLNPRSVLFK